MKKTLIICSTVIAVVVMLTLLGTSVFAAINKSFGANNVIRFVGRGERMQFELEGIITGTTMDGDDRLHTTWTYDFDKGGSGEWQIEPVLQFNRANDSTPMAITYSFSIHNTGNVGIKAYITENRTSDDNFLIEIEGKPDDVVYINTDDTQTVSLTIKTRKQNIWLPEPISCNFKVNFLSF